MSSKATSSSRSSASNRSAAPDQLVALPSVSCSLSSLPQAKSVDSVSLHPSSMSAQRAAESEAKLRKALSKSSSNSHSAVPSAYAPSSSPYSSGANDPALMMRKPLKSKIQV